MQGTARQAEMFDLSSEKLTECKLVDDFLMGRGIVSVSSTACSTYECRLFERRDDNWCFSKFESDRLLITSCRSIFFVSWGLFFDQTLPVRYDFKGGAGLTMKTSGIESGRIKVRRELELFLAPSLKCVTPSIFCICSASSQRDDVSASFLSDERLFCLFRIRELNEVWW